MRKEHNISGKISFYASGIESVRVSRPLDVLNAMEDLEKHFSDISSDFSARIEYGKQLIEDIPYMSSPFDEDLLTMIEADQESLREIYQNMVDNKGVVQLCCKPGEELYTDLLQAMSATKGLFEQQEAVRWAIMEHNADLSREGKGNSLSTDEEIDNFFSSL